MAVARVGRGRLWRKSRQHPGGWSSTDAYKRGAPSHVCGRLARRGVLVTRKKSGQVTAGKGQLTRARACCGGHLFV